jgi:hypothetical protein
MLATCAECFMAVCTRLCVQQYVTLGCQTVVSHKCDVFQHTGNPSRVTRGTVYQAVCVPASCSHQDIETAISQYLQKYQHPAGVQYTVSVAPGRCHTSQQKFSYEDYIFMLVQFIIFDIVNAVKAVLLYAMKARRGAEV